MYWWWDSLFVRLSRLLRLDRVLRLPRSSARVEELLAKQRLYGGSRTNLGYDYDEAARQLAAVANGHLSNGAGAWCGESPTPSMSKWMRIDIQRGLKGNLPPKKSAKILFP